MVAIFVGFRTGDAVTDGEYLQLFGIDAGANLETGTNSAIFGAYAANYKTEVQSSTVLVVTAGYGGGTIKTSVLIGNSTADNNQSSDAKNIENSILIGNFAGRLMDITPTGAGNVLIGNLAGSLTTITGGFNTGVGRSFFSALTTGIQNTAIGDGAGATQATGNQNTSVASTRTRAALRSQTPLTLAIRRPARHPTRSRLVMLLSVRFAAR